MGGPLGVPSASVADGRGHGGPGGQQGGGVGEGDLKYRPPVGAGGGGVVSGFRSAGE